MNIGSSDRAVLLGSDSISVQIQRILRQRQERTADEEELRSCYLDLSEGRWKSTLISMKAKGIISIQNGKITLLRETLPAGEVSDTVWRAVQMKRDSFSVCEIVEICPEILPSTIRTLLTRWSQVGAIYRKVDGGNLNDSVLAVRKGFRLKPRLHTKRTYRDVGGKDRILRELWSVLKSYGETEWTASMLIADLDVDIGQWAYVLHLVSSWEKLGIISVAGTDGDETTYRVDVNLMKEVQ